MGGCASNPGNFRRTWWKEIRPKVPIGDSQSGTRHELFAKLDSDNSGSVSVSSMEQVSSIFHLQSVADNPVAILTEVYTATVGSGKLKESDMPLFVERLRDAFDLFTMVYPERCDIEKPVVNDDVRALEGQFGMVNYEWPSGYSVDKEEPFIAFLKGALKNLRLRPKASEGVKFPLSDTEVYSRDILFAMMNPATDRLEFPNVVDSMALYWALSRFKQFPTACRKSFTDTSIRPEDEEPYLDRSVFRKFLERLDHAMGNTAADSMIDWKALTAHFPFQRTDEQLKIRDRMYADFDDNQTGKMSLAEANAGCRKSYKDMPNVVTDAAVKRAFITAAGADDTGGDAHFVERNEFRVFIANLHDYCQLRAFLDSIGETGNPKKRSIPSMDPFWMHHNEDASACASEVKGLSSTNEIPFETLATWWIRRRRSKDMARPPPEPTTATKSAPTPAPTIDWKALETRFPYQRTSEQLKQRDTMYANFDDNHTGKMSLSEASAGCAKTYRDIPHIVTDAAVKRAFFTAANASDSAHGDSQFVERNEFRVFMANLHDYCQLRAFMDANRMTGDLPKRQIPSMDPFWNFHQESPTECAKEVDKLSSSNDVPFDALANWWIRRRRRDMTSAQRSAPRAAYVAKPSENHAKNVDLWKRLAPTLPRQKTPEESAQRDTLFQQFDENGTGRLSVSECVAGVEKHLRLKELIPKVCLDRAAMKAFLNAAGAMPGDNGSTVERVEFRLFLCYLFDYCVVWMTFDELTPDVWRLKEDVFEAAFPEFQKHGLTLTDPDAAFAAIPGGPTGTVDFDDVVEFLIANGLDVNNARRRRHST